MMKTVLEPLVQQGLSLRRLASELDTSPTSARYWLLKYGLQLKQKPFGPDYLIPKHLVEAAAVGRAIRQSFTATSVRFAALVITPTTSSKGKRDAYAQ
jgi:hypothetical protein